jgi:hypothetical protein
LAARVSEIDPNSHLFAQFADTADSRPNDILRYLWAALSAMNAKLDARGLHGSLIAKQ